MRKAFWVLFIMSFSTARVAQADGEGWIITENRYPIYKSDHLTLRLRLLTDFRVAGRTHGLQQALFRGGLILQPLPWFWLASQTTFNAQPTGQSEAGGLLFQEEFRQEFEANLGLDWGWGRMSHRHRAEVRFINRAFAYRHRIQLRLAFYQPGWRLWPIVYDEFHIDPQNSVNQNRLGAGVEISLLPVLRMELTYVMKWRSKGTYPNYAGEIDHVARLYLIYSADQMF